VAAAAASGRGADSHITAAHTSTKEPQQCSNAI
jgi:hypothetical protein